MFSIQDNRRLDSGLLLTSFETEELLDFKKISSPLIGIAEVSQMIYRNRLNICFLWLFSPVSCPTGASVVLTCVGVAGEMSWVEMVFHFDSDSAR